MNTSLGQVAYEATQQAIASNGDFYGNDAEPWEQLPPPYREAWEAGAQAVLAANAANHPSAEVPGTRAVGEGSIWAAPRPIRLWDADAEPDGSRKAWDPNAEPEEPERLA